MRTQPTNIGTFGACAKLKSGDVGTPSELVIVGATYFRKKCLERAEGTKEKNNKSKSLNREVASPIWSPIVDTETLGCENEVDQTTGVRRKSTESVNGGNVTAGHLVEQPATLSRSGIIVAEPNSNEHATPASHTPTPIRLRSELDAEPFNMEHLRTLFKDLDTEKKGRIYIAEWNSQLTKSLEGSPQGVLGGSARALQFSHVQTGSSDTLSWDDIVDAAQSCTTTW